MHTGVDKPAMSELDHLREEVAYLKFWLGIIVVIEVSVAGWLVSAFDTAPSYAAFLAVCGLILFGTGSDSEPRDRAADFEDQGAIAVELIAYLAAFGVILLIAGMAFYVGREK